MLTATIQSKKRIASIDILRGIVMVVMALDHIRDYFHAPAFLYDPLDLQKTSTAIFLSRWITHYCAPVFMLLTGTSAFMVGERKGIKALSKFLFTRGLFLVFLELTIINFAWNFNVHFPEIDFLVLWSLGISMIALSAMVYLPKKIILAIGIILVAGHNLLDNVHVSGEGLDAFGWSLLHEPGLFTYAGKKFFVLYPIVPWIGIIALGYSLGNLYSKDIDIQQRKKILLWLGAGAVLLFIIIRFTNIYGDPVQWTRQSSAVFTMLSFINVAKYPPSFLYALMTIGPALIFLALSETKPGRLSKVFTVFGRTAMFYYVLHIYLIHLLAMFATSLCGYKWTDMIWGGFTNDQLLGYGFPLIVVYMVWIVVVSILYPLCKWYDRYKTSHREKWWLSYL
jgi:uncharacterized membrane protein